MEIDCASLREIGQNTNSILFHEAKLSVFLLYFNRISLLLFHEATRRGGYFYRISTS
jgi:hypothetical protein